MDQDIDGEIQNIIIHLCQIHLEDILQKVLEKYLPGSNNFFTGLGFTLACIVLVFKVIFSAKVQDFAECDLDGEIEILGVIPEVKE